MFNCAKIARKIVLWLVVMMAITACTGSIIGPDDDDQSGTRGPVEPLGYF